MKSQAQTPLTSNEATLPPLKDWWFNAFRECSKRDDDPFALFSFSFEAQHGLTNRSMFDELLEEDIDQSNPSLTEHYRSLVAEFPEIGSVSIRKKIGAINRMVEEIAYLYYGVDVEHHSSEIVVARARHALLLPALLKEAAEEIRNTVRLEEGHTLRSLWEMQGNGGHESKSEHQEAFLTLMDHPVQRFVNHLRNCAEIFTHGKNDICGDSYPPVEQGLRRILESYAQSIS